MALKKVAIGPEEGGRRADKFFAELFPELSRERIKDLIKQGQIQLFDPRQRRFRSFRPSLRLEAGMLFQWEEEVLRPEENQLLPESVPLEVLYEDEYLLAVNKPAGMVVHPGAGVKAGTLANALLGYLGDDLAEVGDKERPGIVHRLDKETSGLLLVAKDRRTHARLSRMFERRQVRKDYLALVWGSPEYEEDVIDLPIERHPRHRDLFRVGTGPSSRPAITEYEVLARYPENTLLLVHPITGRTHQIRVHLSYLGLPIVGDPKYGRKGDASPRMCLHAFRVELAHPITGEPLKISTQLPDFVEAKDEIKKLLF